MNEDWPERPDVVGIPARPDLPSPDPAAATDRSPRSHRSRTATALVAAVALFVGGMGAGWFLSRDPASNTSGVSASSSSPIRVAPAPRSGSSRQVAGSLDAQAIAAKVSPAIVDINTVIPSDPFSSSGGRAGTAAGTGMIVTSDGEVLTNNHVISGSSSIRVTFQGRSGSYPATVLGADPARDVALLQVSGVSGLPTVTLADSSSVTVGQQVVALGNALGRGGAPAVAEGTVTAVDRSITVGDDRGGAEHLTNMIQTNAPIQPGDSGGPLVNASGQVIGMVTAGTRMTGFNPSPTLSAGFAIPTTSAVTVVNQIRAGRGGPTLVIGQPGYLGIQAQELDSATAAQLGLPVSSGALVAGVVAGGPAARAGITQGSVITSIDGRAIGSATDLGPAIRRHHPGTSIRVTWLTSSGTHTATVVLISGPAV